jgi:ABC-type branched-subunit amino acid transport system substrate-binding protein
LITLFSSCHSNVKDDEWITGGDDDDTVEAGVLLRGIASPLTDDSTISSPKEDVQLNPHEKLVINDSRNILIVLPLSGHLEGIGKRIKSAIVKTNQELEEPFKLAFFDTQSEMYYRKGDLYDFVIKNDIKYIVGGLQKDDTKDIVEVASLKNILVFSLTPDNKLSLEYKNLYIQSITPENITYSVVKYAIEEKGFRKFAILYPYTDIGLEYYNYFKYYVDYMGGELVQEALFSPKTNDFDKPISKLVGRDEPYKRADFLKLIRKTKKSNNPYWKNRYINQAKMKLKPIFDYDAIFLPISDKKVNYIVPLLASWDLPLQTNNPRLMEQVYHKYLDKNQKYVQIFGTPFWYNEKLFEANSPYINGAIFPSPYNTDLDNDAIPFILMFKDRITKKESLIYEALIYDMINIIYYVFEKKDNIENYEGIMGRYLLYKNQFFKDFGMAIIHNDKFLSY